MVHERRPGPPTSQSVFPSVDLEAVHRRCHPLAGRRRKSELEAPVGEYLPEWFAGEPDLRISHLLTHTSASPTSSGCRLSAARRRSGNAQVSVCRLAAAAAARSSRVNAGPTATQLQALALIAERVAGKPFDTVLAIACSARPESAASTVPRHRASRLRPAMRRTASWPARRQPGRLRGDAALCELGRLVDCFARAGLARSERRSSRGLRRPPADFRPVCRMVRCSIREFLGHALIWHAGNVDGTARSSRMPRRTTAASSPDQQGVRLADGAAARMIGEPFPHGPA